MSENIDREEQYYKKCLILKTQLEVIKDSNIDNFELGKEEIDIVIDSLTELIDHGFERHQLNTTLNQFILETLVGFNEQFLRLVRNDSDGVRAFYNGYRELIPHTAKLLGIPLRVEKIDEVYKER